MKMTVNVELSEVPINAMPLVDDTDFKTIKTGLAYNMAGLLLYWNFVTPAGSYTQVRVVPTNTSPTSDYAFGNVGGGMYAIDIPASGGTSANNNTAGYGWFTGVATGVLPWAGPIIQFSPANVVDSLVSGTASLKVDIDTIKTNPVVNGGTITFPTTATLASTTNITAATGVDITKILGTSISTPATAGILDVNVKNIDNDAASASGTVTFPNATLASTTNITAATGVDITKILGTTISTPATAGILDVNVKNIDNDAASASGTVTFPNATLASTTNVTAGTITTVTNLTNAPTAGDLTATMKASVQTAATASLTAAFLDKLVSVSGTSDSGSTTTMVDAARTEGDNDYWKGSIIVFTSGTIAGQARMITDFVAATDTFTFAPATTQAVSTQTYIILPAISVWDDVLAEHLGSGSAGNALNAAGSAGDPWATAIPGAYGAGTAGLMLGTTIPAKTNLIPASPASTTNITAGTITTVTNLTNAPTAGDLTATMKASINTEADTALADYDAPTHAELTAELATADDATLAQVALVKAKTDLIPSSPAAVGSAMTLTAGERNSIADAAFLRAMVEAYPVDGAAPTLAEALFLILQNIQEFSIAGTTITVKKLNGSTTAATYTLDSSTAPTSRTRTT